MALVGCEFLLLVALARFGLASLVAGILGAHIDLLLLFLRSFWLRKGVEFRIQLPRSEAPELFKVIQQLCQKAQVEMLQEISIEMGVNAWVRLKGYRRGSGRTILGIGYDLLAGLSESEMGGVLAHEITHAKLVQRGLKNWLNRGLNRMVQLARGLHAHIEVLRRTKKPMEPARVLFGAADRLTRLAARLVAGCSRQDEFEADHGAAALCGPGAIRSSLQKLLGLAERSARLPWNERFAQLQAGKGFTTWLVEELAGAGKHTEEAKQNLFFKYSTHPSLADRLAALPPELDETPHESRPAIILLKDPDRVAERLMSQIQKMAAEQERKDSKRLRRWTRKGSVHTHLRPLQSCGVFLALIGFIGGLILFLSGGPSFGAACFSLGTIALGILGFRYGHYRERIPLAVPDFALLKAAWQKRPNFTQDQVKAMEAELQSAACKTRKRELALATASYEALARCDYIRAHVAARLCLQVNRKSVEGGIGLAVAGAALGQIEQVHHALNFLRRATGMSAPSTSWGAGWALLLCGDWVPAEAFLEKRCQQKPQSPTLLLLLAFCQSQRGKWQSALTLARQACDPEPANNEHAKFLIDLLLQAGFLSEAQERLQRLECHVKEDGELMLSLVRLNLLLRDFSTAEKWVELLKNSQPGFHLLVRLGNFHEIARQNIKAAEFYHEALAGGFYPEALMGLARLEAQARNKEQARKHLLAALNTQRALGERATGPLPLFHPILTQLLALEDPVLDCRAWVATLADGKAFPALANKSLLVFGPTRQAAEESIRNLFGAMQPGAPPPLPSSIVWGEARKEQQPDGPVRPGVQGILN